MSSPNMVIKAWTSFKPHAAGLVLPLLVVLLYCLLPSSSAISFDLPNLSNSEISRISFAGDASPTEDGVQLTKVTYGEIHHLFYSTGRAVYSQPIPLWDSVTRSLVSFTTNFSFFVGNVAQKNLNGDGIAFIIAANGTFIPEGAIGGFLGLYSKETIWDAEAARQGRVVAVEFDIYPNPEWDPKHMHLGINIESIESVNHTYWTEYTNHTINTTVSATVTYEADTKKLSAWMVDGNGRRATVSFAIDLREVLPGPFMYVGFSATTGLNIEHHRLLNWSFRSSMVSSITLSLRSKSTSTRFLVVLAAGLGAASLTIFFTGACFFLYFLRRSRSV